MFAWFRKIFNQTIAYFRNSNGHGPPLELTITLEALEAAREAVAEPARPGPTVGDSGSAQGKQGGAVDDGMPARDGAPTPAQGNTLSVTLEPVTSSQAIADEVFPGRAPKVNRAARRKILALERARLKHDRWVEPKGELPAPLPPRLKPEPAEAAEPTAQVAPPQDSGPNDPGEFLIVDPIDGKDVLFLERELYGTFHFRDTVLDQLELYWTYLRRMRAHDSDAYYTYKRLGAIIVPPVMWDMHDGPHTLAKKDVKPSTEKKKLTAWWKQNRPSFGCLSYGITSRVENYELNDRTDLKKNEAHWIPKFMYFQKYSQPPSEVQPTTNGDVYMMTVWWDKPHDPKIAKAKGGVPGSYPIYISKDGSDIHILKLRETFSAPPKKIKNRSYKDGKKGRKKPRSGRALKVYNTWHYPKVFQDWARDNQTDLDIFLCNIFQEAATAFESTGFGMTRVEVTNGDLTAVFSVDPRRMGYFFKDRDITLTKDGNRQRIFHMVKPHTRKLRDGTSKYVPFAFRGLREFEWAGYHVKITVPARDHFMLNEFDVGVMDSEFLEDGEAAIGAEELAEKLHGWMERGIGSET